MKKYCVSDRVREVVKEDFHYDCDKGKGEVEIGLLLNFSRPFLWGDQTGGRVGIFVDDEDDNNFSYPS